MWSFGPDTGSRLALTETWDLDASANKENERLRPREAKKVKVFQPYFACLLACRKAFKRAMKAQKVPFLDKIKKGVKAR